jgi:hypothetical protein
MSHLNPNKNKDDGDAIDVQPFLRKLSRLYINTIKE